jgi:DNA-binding transcriptional LysR family regulator
MQNNLPKMQNQRNITLWMQTALAITKTGSPGHAARQLGISVTTIYRHIDAFERSLGQTLFERCHSGWELHPGAAALLSTGKEIDRLLAQALHEMRNANSASGGTLRIALSDDLAVYYIASHLRGFCEAHTNIRPDLIVSSDFADLTQGEADIAIRPDMDPGDTLIGHRVGTMTHALYASYDYIKQHGGPATLRALNPHRFCGYGAALTEYTAAKWLAEHVPDSRIAARFDTTTLMAQAVAAGVGIGLLPCFVGDRLSSAKAVMKLADSMPIDIWLVSAARNRNKPEIQAFFKYFGTVMRADAARFKGEIYASP